MKMCYISGDATNPKLKKNQKCIIVHCCNNIGVWGAGFTGSISKKWTRPEAMYLKKKSYVLGNIELISVENNIQICNMIGQRGVKSPSNPEPVNYKAIEIGLKTLSAYMNLNKVKVLVMPKIGCGLAGGKWTEIEPIIKEAFRKSRVTINVYSYEVGQQMRKDSEKKI